MRFFSTVLFNLIILFFSFSVLADELIIEQDMGRKPILDFINHAQHSLHFLMYGFTDPTLSQALIEKKSQGKSIQIILEQHPYAAENENDQTIKMFNAYHLNWRSNPLFLLIHQKTLITENKALVMTFNFTRSAFKHDRNFALLIDDPKTVKQIDAIFSADWNHQPIHNINNDLVLSPDDSRKKILRLIAQATQSIKIYAQIINDYQITGALKKAAQRGIKIDILTSANMHTNTMRYLKRAGINIHQSKHYYIHAKVLIVDNNKALIGSINLSQPSLDKNRELAVLTRDKTVLKQLTATFIHDVQMQ